MVHSAPLRVGIVLSVNSSSSVTGLDDVGVALLCGFNYVMQNKDAVTALSFLHQVAGSTDKVTVEDVKQYLRKKFDDDPLDILGEDSDYDFGRKLAEDFIQRTGIKALPQALLNGIPLPSAQITVDEFEEAVLQEVMSQTPNFQKAIYRGRLQDKDDVFEYLMTQSNVMPRLNERILNKDSSVNLDMSGKATSTMDVRNLIKLSPRDMTATALENLRYFTVPRKQDRYYSITYWIVGDLNEKKTRDLLLDALEHLVKLH